MGRRALHLLLLVAFLVVSMAGCLEDEPTEALDEAVTMQLGDPLAAGALTSILRDWDLGNQLIQGSSGPYLVHIHGSAHVPEGTGPFPVVLLMHGRHSTCATEIGERNVQPCPELAPVATPVDSYAGYDYLAESLASHGYAVLSVDANNVNDRDNENRLLFGDDLGATARARIIHDVLRALADANEGNGEGGLESLSGQLDLTRVGLMGHSRGGEGVARAWSLARDEGSLPDGIAIRAVFALAPSDFGRQDIRGVPFAVLLPYCDGDMYDLSGSMLYDDAREINTEPMHQFLTMGANHNYYNTVWTRSDWLEGDDEWCDETSPTSGRDTPEAQRLHGIALMGGFLRHYLGGEENLGPFLTGHSAWPVSGIVTSYHPAHAQLVFGDEHFVGAKPLVDGSAKVDECFGMECPALNTYTIAKQTVIRWDGPGSYRVAVADARDRNLSFRIGLDPATVDQEELDGMGVIVRFGRPGEATETYLPLADLGGFVPPGDYGAKTILNTVHVPLSAGAFEVALTFDVGEGLVQVADWLYV